MAALVSSRSGNGTPLVLVHGLGARSASWQPVLPGLTGSREVVAVDLPGHGASPSLTGELTFERLTGALQDWLEQADLADADLVGSSMGARMVLELARRGLGRHVVALDPGGFWNGAEKALFAASVKASFALVRALRPALPALTGSPIGRAALLPQFSPRPWAVPGDVALADLRSIADTSALDETLQALVDSGPQLGGPTPGRVLLGWGRRDRVTLPRQAARARAAFPGSSVHWFDRCGHFPMWDRPGETARVVLAATA
jgi:pimeloyl-ACP methyl ester carboxylesterase